MKKETLRMQMLAGIITEGQYVANLNKNKEIIFTPDQEKKYQDAMVKKFYKDLKSDGENEAVDNLLSGHNNEIIIANILSGFKELRMDWYNEIGDWDMGDEDEEEVHPTYVLTSNEYDLDEVKEFMDKMLEEFKSSIESIDPDIEEIIKSYL